MYVDICCQTIGGKASITCICAAKAKKVVSVSSVYEAMNISISAKVCNFIIPVKTEHLSIRRIVNLCEFRSPIFPKTMTLLAVANLGLALKEYEAMATTT